MAVSLKFAMELRNKLYQLNLSNIEDWQIYQEATLSFIRGNEDEKLTIYKDIKGNKTISLGFNMDNSGAKNMWYKIFQNSLSFDQVYAGRQKITIKQSRMIYDCKIITNRRELKNTYSNYWDKLRANEMLMIEDLYWNGGNMLVGITTKFFNHIMLYLQTSELKYLALALSEVKERSNKEKNLGIQNRRNVQCEIGNSAKCLTKL